MKHTIRIRALLAVGVAAILVGLAGTVTSGSDAARSLGISGVKFKVRYQGSFDASWHNSSPVLLPDPDHVFRCSGGDESGTLTSTVHSNTKPFIFILGKEPGGTGISHDFRPRQGLEHATVSSNRTAQGFLMRYSGHQCIREEIPQPGCGAHTFLGNVVPISSSNGRLDSGINPVYHVYLEWQMEPELAIGCSDGIVLPQAFGYGWQDDVLRARALYRCGMKHPRRCKLTLHRDQTYVFNDTQGGITYSSTVHLNWTVTLTAAGRS